MTITPPPIAVTMGDPSGVGGEIILKSWKKHRDKLTPFYVIDDLNRLEGINRQLNLNCNIKTVNSFDGIHVMFKDCLPVCEIGNYVMGTLGKSSSQDTPVVTKSIEIAVEHIYKGLASALVTNPINKAHLYESGFPYPGHTEFLAYLASVETEPVMMLASDKLRVVPVTRHLALREAIQTLSASLIIETAETTFQALQKDFGITDPQIAISGLNPHAGEGGTIGREEIEIIQPAIKKLQQSGLTLRGPLSADTLFHEGARQNYDAVLCMYHDQALIPIKTLDFHAAVNVTLGLPFIRTSPDHGTAMDIAGMGIADESSLVAALKLAAELAHNRDQYPNRA